MANKKKTGKAFKALKREGKFRKESFPQNKPKIVIPPNAHKKKQKEDLSNLSAAEVFERQIQELEQRKHGKKAKVEQIAKIAIAAPTFVFVPTQPAEPSFTVDRLLEGEESFIPFNPSTENKTEFKKTSMKNRFEALMDSDDEEEAKKKPVMALQPATFTFNRPEFDDI